MVLVQQRLALWLVFLNNGLQEDIDYQGFLHIIEQGIDGWAGEEILSTDAHRPTTVGI